MMQNPIPKLRKIKLAPRLYLKFPENPGIYIYFKKNVPIYVGKAINLKKRVSSYFRVNLETKTKRMMSEAESVSLIKVTNELEALLLEAKLIKFYQPKYNIISKDDKHPLYIKITKEKYPRIITVRKADLENIPSLAAYGPFPSSGSVRSVLKVIRRIFPYSDHKIGKRACLYSQIRLCDPCPNEIENNKDPLKKQIQTQKYKTNIRHIKTILDGKITSVKKALEREMKDFSVQENYEGAAEVRNKILRLMYITSPRTSVESYLENPNLVQDIRDKELKELSLILKKFFSIKSITRIECFDVAHLQGVGAGASMITFLNGVADKKYYRHFRIRQEKGQDDYQSMREISERRKKHLNDWGRPDLIIVDGGVGQLSVFLKEFKEEKIPVIGLAKRFETLVIPVEKPGAIEMEKLRLQKGPALNLVQRIRNEAHRFAQAYHHKLFTRSLFESR